ncbi:unnamed protein product [Arabidopsis halleri]
MLVNSVLISIGLRKIIRAGDYFTALAGGLCLDGFAGMPDWGTCLDTRRCVLRVFVLFLVILSFYGSPRNSGANEWYADAGGLGGGFLVATKELLWFARMLKDLHIQVTTKPKLFCDNKSSLHIANNPVFHERIKHVEIVCHTTRDQVKNGFMKVFHVSTNNQLADILTKALHPGPFYSILTDLCSQALFLPKDDSV